MAIKITGNDLTIEDVYRVAHGMEKVELHPDALERIKACRAFLEKKIAEREIMYGINTGIGEFSEVILSDEQVQQFQRYLIYNHSAGIGEPVPIEEVRAAMLTRINVHANGNSGCRPEITQTYVEMLNKGGGDSAIDRHAQQKHRAGNSQKRLRRRQWRFSAHESDRSAADG